MLVSATTNGATPLVMASRNGHLDVADYLLDRCNADIEQVCNLQCCTRAFYFVEIVGMMCCLGQ